MPFAGAEFNSSRRLIMITLITTIVEIVFKIAKLASRIAFNRITVILTFCASIATVVSYIFSSLSEQSSFVYSAFTNLESISSVVADWVAGNDYCQLIGYALSLDVVLDGLLTTLIWIVCTLGGVLITVSIYVFYAVLPLMADLILSGLQKQQERIQSAISK